MAFFIPYDQFVPLLNSQNENTVKNALQDIFELLVNGNTIERSRGQIFKQDIEKLVKSASKKVRKWAYHCACFYQDEMICQSIKIKLMTEQSRDNIIWALMALSVTYDDEHKLQQCAGKRHEEFMETISRQYARDALVLFGGVVSINPKTILLTNNSADLEALTQIYAYDGLVHGLYPDVTDSVICEIETHDDSRVREYAYWAQVLRKTKRELGDAKEDPNPDVRKWQIALQIENGDQDFVISTLKPLAMCSNKISLDVKNGVIRGLNNISYNIDYVPLISRWFAFETEETIVFQLLNYFIMNCSLNREDGTFFYAIKDSLNNNNLSKYIVSKIKGSDKYGLRITENGESFVLDFVNNGGQLMQNVNISGSGNVLNTGSGNTMSVANDHSSATIITSTSEVNELAKLIEEVRIQAKAELSEDDQEKVEGALSTIENQTTSERPKKSFIKMLLDGLSNIKNVAKDAVQFGTAVTALIQFFE